MSAASVFAAETLAKQELETQWGVEFSPLRLTPGGTSLELRFTVKDAQKARALVAGTTALSLRHHATGTAIAATGSVQAREERSYAVSFANPRKMVKQGHGVTVVIGDYQATLVVE